MRCGGSKCIRHVSLVVRPCKLQGFKSTIMNFLLSQIWSPEWQSLIHFHVLQCFRNPDDKQNSSKALIQHLQSIKQFYLHLLNFQFVPPKPKTNNKRIKPTHKPPIPKLVHLNPTKKNYGFMILCLFLHQSNPFVNSQLSRLSLSQQCLESTPR